MKIVCSLVMAAVGMAASSCAPGDTPLATVDAGLPPGSCFVPETVRNFRPDGDAVVYVRAGRGQVFQLNGGFCRGLSSARSLALRPGPGGGRACVGDSVEIAVAGPGLQGENNSLCRARVEARLSDEQVAALAPRLRP